MQFRITKRKNAITSMLLAFVLLAGTLVSTTSQVLALSTFSISETGPTVAVDEALVATSSEWRLEAQATLQANTNNTPQNAALIFGYVDTQNYYYADFAEANGDGLNGIFRVSNGSVQKLAAFSSFAASGTHSLQLRHRTGEIKVYIDGVYLTKVSGVSVANTKLGVATKSANASFADPVFVSGTTTSPLALTAVSSIPSSTTTPPPTNDPNPTPTPTPGAPGSFTIEEAGANGAVDQAASSGTGEWRLSSSVTATNGSTGFPANAALVFGFVDQNNYYYASFAAASGNGLNGVYKVTNGIVSKIMGYGNFLTPNQARNVEIRYKSSAIKIYVDGTYQLKIDNVSPTGTKVGVAAFDTGATFQNTLLTTSASTALTLEPVDLIAQIVVDPNQSLPTPSNPTRTTSTGRQVTVTNSSELQAAITTALPGDTITMADGTYASSMAVNGYTGSFAITASGTETNPITLIASSGAVIDGNGTGGRYGLYLNNADYWNLVGFTVNNASKGIVLDGSNHVFMENVTVSNVGAEAIHFRAFSSYNVVKNSTITATGRNSAQFGEGIYIGSASGANWGIYSGGQPDTSDRNIIIGNTLSDFTAEGIDIKEGSTGNYIANNTFEGSSISGENSADSWVDVKGNYNLLEGNVGTNTLVDGFQVHNVYPGWGANNLFRNNTANVNASGYGFMIGFSALNLGNTIECNNVVTGAASGNWNISSCTGV